MSERPARTLVTSALPYANGPIHLGHLAGAYLPADLYVRHLRLRGEDVAFVCGSDEMGVAILMRAHAEGRTPREVVDEFHPVIEDALRRAGMSFDHYGRTSSETHKQTAQAFFQTLADAGVFRLNTEDLPFDPVAGVFLADRFVRGTCPICGNEDAYGDQCERCGSSLSPSELIRPRSVLSDAAPEWRPTTHWYLPLGEVQPRLQAWLDEAATDWKPNVTGQVRSWLAEGLKDRAITRDIAWGVPVPERAAQEAGVDATGKVLYVWFDAPLGYVSATKEWAEKQGQPERWRDYWQRDDTRLVHFIGKDNIVFHCLIFPAMLMLHGGYVLPEQVPANEFLNLEGQKFSTSRGWAVWLHDLLDRFDADLVRYALAATLPETKDADFSFEDFQGRINNDLADVLGNFVNRTLTFAGRQFEGVVPTLAEPDGAADDVLAMLAAAPALIAAHYEAFRFRDAVFETMALARAGNKYFNDAAPWHQIKTDRQAAANTIHVALQLCASLSVLLEPVVPAAAARLRRMLHLEGVRSSEPDGDAGTIGWDDAARPLLSEGHALGTSEILFAKLDDAMIEAERVRLAAAGAALTPGTVEETEPARPFPPLAPEITYDDFARLDLRAGRILAAEPVPKADKLLRLDVDLGFETRQVLSGIREHFSPEEVIGKTFVVVANLAPRTIRGLESKGMLLFAEDREGRLRPVEADAEPGSVVK